MTDQQIIQLYLPFSIEAVDASGVAQEVDSVEINILSFAKPLLIPLSKLTDEQIKELNSDSYEIQWSDLTWDDRMLTPYEDITLSHVSLGVIKLLSWHYDIFNWIEQGRALDKTEYK